MPQAVTPVHGLWLYVAKTNNQSVHEVAVHNWGRGWFPYKNNLHHPLLYINPSTAPPPLLFCKLPHPWRLPSPWLNYIELWTPFLGAQRWALSSIWNVPANTYTNIAIMLPLLIDCLFTHVNYHGSKLHHKKFITLYIYSYSNNSKMTIHVFCYCGSKYSK